MPIITSKTIADMPQVLRLDDLVIAPPPKSLQALTTVLEPCLADAEILSGIRLGWNRAGLRLTRAFELFIALDSQAEELLALDPKPDWFQRLPLTVRQHLADSERIQGRLNDEILVVCNLPYSNLSYSVLDGALVADVVKVFGLHRLHNVGQLGLLCIPQDPTAGHQPQVNAFPHTRFEHVMSVMAVATLIAHNVRLTESERNHLRVAALTHDTLTPAGGDTVKRLDMEAFDEDKHYPELFERLGWKQLSEKYQLSEELLKETVLGKGKLGKLLDLADKITYTATDIRNLLERQPLDASDGVLVVRELIKEFPHLCDVWDAVECRGEEVAFNDPDRLATFLKARTLMFKYVYFDADAGRFEMMYVHRYLKPMYEQGIITRDWLLERGDNDLIKKLEHFMGRPIHHHVFGDQEDLVVETFTDEDEARRREAEMKLDGASFVRVERFGGKIKPSLHLPVFNAASTAVPFALERPDMAAELEKIADITKRFRLYAFISR